MAYAHAERNLAALRQLEAETWQLLASLDQPDPEQSAWLQEYARSEKQRQAGVARLPGRRTPVDRRRRRASVPHE